MPLTYLFEVKDNGSATVKKIGNEADKLTGKLKKTDETVGKLGIGLANLGAHGLSKASSELWSFAKEMVDAYDSASKLSVNIGITADSVLGLRHAAELSNVGAEAMDKNMQKLSKTMFEAASGNKQAGESFKRLGVDVKNSDGSLKKSDEVLLELADKFKDLPPGAERAAAAMDIFGKSGASMVTVLKDGSGALKKMIDEGAGAAGNVEGISEAMEKLKEASTKAKAAMMGMLAGIVDSNLFKAMVSGLNSVSEAMIKWNNERKAEANKERKINEEILSDYTLQIAKLNLIKETTGELTASQDRLKKSIQSQVVALNKKLGLEDEEKRLMIAKANTMAAIEQYQLSEDSVGEETKKRLIGNIELYNNQVLAIEKNRDSLAKASILPTETKKDDSAQKAYEAETKRLNDWLDNYEKSKRTEREIADDNYATELENLKKMKERGMLIEEAYTLKVIALNYDHQAKIDELYAKDKEEKLKAEAEKLKAAEETQSKLWELRKIAAKDDYEVTAQIELEQLNAKYATELKMAQDNKEMISAIKAAQSAETEAISRKAVELKAAEYAEVQRKEKELAQTRMDMNVQYINSSLDVAEAMNALGKKNGNAQKAISIAQATINTALAATKAATAAPWPYNIPLVAGAVAQGAVQIAAITAQKFARGGMIPGSNTLIMANEEGREAILNTRAVRAVGGEAGVNALNRGTSNTYNNSRSNSVSINVSTAIMTQKTFRDEIEPVLKRAARRR